MDFLNCPTTPRRLPQMVPTRFHVMTSSNPLFSMNLGTNQERSSYEADPEGRNKVKNRLLILFKKKQLLAKHVASSVGEHVHHSTL